MHRKSFLRVTKYYKNDILRAFLMILKLKFTVADHYGYTDPMYNPEESREALWYSRVLWCHRNLSFIGYHLLTNYSQLKTIFRNRIQDKKIDEKV